MPALQDRPANIRPLAFPCDSNSELSQEFEPAQARTHTPRTTIPALPGSWRLPSEGMSEPRRYDIKIMYSVEVTDPVAVIAAAYARWCAKHTAVEEFTDWHR